MTCRICGEEKFEKDFTFRRDSGKYRTDCNECRAAREAARRYGLTVGEVEELKDAQDNRCAICGTHADDVPHASFKHNPLVIDHDHESGEVRGLLCPTCNAGLGHFKDSASLLTAAAQYILSR